MTTPRKILLGLATLATVAPLTDPWNTLVPGVYQYWAALLLCSISTWFILTPKQTE